MTRTNTMKAVPWIAVALLSALPMLVPTSASAQSPTPELVPAADAGCFVRKIWDVSSVEGADAANWELRYSPAPSPTTNVESAEIVDSREGRQIARNIRNDLRDFRPVLDGSRWFFRVVAASGTEPIGEWSAPAVYDAAYSPNGMYQASASDLSLTLTWALTNDLGNCADRVHYEVRKDSPGGSPIRSETVSGASGSRTVDVSATGAGTYYVRLAAFYGSDAAEDAVGRVGDDVQVTVEAPVAEEPTVSPERVAVTNPLPAQRPVQRRPVPGRPTPFPSIQLTSFELQGGASQARVNETVSLDARYSGSPSEFRAALCDAFAQATWRPFSRADAPTMTFPTAGDKEVCFQLRDGRVVSDMLRDGIRILAPNVVSVEVVAQEAVQPNVSIVSFQLREGRRYARIGAPVTLNAAAREDPAYYRAAERGSGGCSQTLESRGWRQWTPNDPPTMRFGSPGTKRVCFQLARQDGSGKSPIVEDSIEILRDMIQHDYIGASGGGGPGNYQSTFCPEGTGYPVGLRIASDQFVDAVFARCATLSAGGLHQGVATSVRGAGGGGGTERNLDCGTGRVLTGIRMYYGEVVDRLTIGCAPWNATEGVLEEPTWGSYLGGGGGVQAATQACPVPYQVTYMSVVRKQLIVLGPYYVARISLRCELSPDL